MANEVTAADVFRFQLHEQRGITLRGAEELLGEVQELVRRLRAGGVPTLAFNINTVGRVLADHAKLVVLKETLEVVTKT